MCYRSWLSCWMKRSWAEFLCWSLQTSRTCWQPPQPPRSQRVSTCTPSAIACGRSSPAPPSPERGFRWAYELCCFFLLLFLCAVFLFFSCAAVSLKFTFRRVWIGSASLSTPRKNSFASSHLLLRRNSSTHTHTYTDIHCILLSVSMMGYICECKRTTNPTWTWSV